MFLTSGTFSTSETSVELLPELPLMTTVSLSPNLILNVVEAETVGLKGFDDSI